MEFGFFIMWVLVFCFLYYERQYHVMAIFALLALFSGAIPVSLPWL
ncbi:MAG: hypothetical protein V1787_04585 [Candidatus Micrarchaeota archaeon]